MLRRTREKSFSISITPAHSIRIFPANSSLDFSGELCIGEICGVLSQKKRQRLLLPLGFCDSVVQIGSQIMPVVLLLNGKNDGMIRFFPLL